jgi:hypothetical protein
VQENRAPVPAAHGCCDFNLTTCPKIFDLLLLFCYLIGNIADETSAFSKVVTEICTQKTLSVEHAA